MSNEQLIKLIFLSLLWGASFLFIGVAVKELEPLLLVALRVSIASLTLLPILYLFKGKLPTHIRQWIPFLGMGLLNNVIPFTAIFYAQQHISVSLASIINATTPIFTFGVLALFGGEKLLPNKLFGSLAGLIGVVILLNPSETSVNGTSIGILFSLTAALSYGISAYWAKKHLTNIPALESTTGQLISSSLIMALLLPLIGVEIPDQLPSTETTFSILALATLSTAFAYIIFFNIIRVSGPSNAFLVTLLVPLSGSMLGWLFMGDRLQAHQVVGALTIGFALVLIDGRLFRRVSA